MVNAKAAVVMEVIVAINKVVTPSKGTAVEIIDTRTETHRIIKVRIIITDIELCFYDLGIEFLSPSRLNHAYKCQYH